MCGYTTYSVMKDSALQNQWRNVVLEVISPIPAINRIGDTKGYSPGPGYLLANCSKLTRVNRNVCKWFPNNSNSYLAYFQQLFVNCSKLTMLPELWKTHPDVYHDECFTGCTGASNYQDAIDAGWA